MVPIPSSVVSRSIGSIFTSTGISLMHDEGTGGNTEGGYGFFPLFPLTNCSFSNCPVGLDARKANRSAGADGEFVGLMSRVLNTDFSSMNKINSGYARVLHFGIRERNQA